MAKLSVYNTIDRSQLGGKFVPLIQSGVSNYKILASDLGKEYHPGDAIEITDAGEINVKFNSDDFDVSSGSLIIKTDESRGVFKGSDGIYIASADSTIDVSSSGIKVNRSNLVSRISGAGLKAVGEMVDVNPADDTIDVGMDGIRVNTSALSIPNAHSLAGSGLESVDSNTLYVKSANDSISVSPAGIKVNTSFLAGRYLRSDSNHGITVDTAPLAHAITGSGLVETNGTIGVNVNTATGIIVNDNKLYLNAGNGLQTTNNIVKVKAANNSIGVSSAGIKVDTYYLAGHGLSSYYGTLLCVHSADKFIKVAPTGVGLHYQNLISSLANSSGGSSNIKIAYNYLYTATGDGLRWGSNNAIYVKSANSTIDVSSSGIKVNPGYSLSSTSVGLEVNPSNDTLIVDSGGVSVNTSYLAGYGLSSVYNSLEVKPADNTIDVGPDGIKVNPSALSIPTASSLVGSGLTSKGSYLYVQSADGSIGVSTNGVYVKAGAGLETTPVGLSVKSSDGSIIVSDSGIRVDLRNAMYVGSGLTNSTGELAVKAADNTIDVSSAGIKVSPSALAGNGLTEHVLGGSLQVLPSDSTISVSSSGVSVNYGLSLTKDASGRLISALYAGSGVKLKDNYISLHTGDGLEITNSGAVYVKSADSSIGVGADGIKVLGYGLSAMDYGLAVKVANSTISLNNDGIKVKAGYGLETTSYGLYVKSADNTVDVSSSGIKVNTSALSIPDANSLAGNGLHSVNGSALYVKSADNTIDVSYGGVKVNYGLSLTKDASGRLISALYAGSGVKLKDNYISLHTGDGLEITNSGAVYVKSADNTISSSSEGIKVNSGSLAGAGLSTDAGKLYVKSADGTIGVTSSGIGVNVTNGGGILTGANGLYIDSAQLAGSGLKASSAHTNAKLSVNVGLYDSSSKNNSPNLLKLNTATNELYVSGVDVTGIIGTNNTMTRQQDPTSYYHSFGVDVDYLFSTYTDRATLVYSGNKLSVHLSSIAGENIGYNPTSKSLYVSSGGSIVGVDVDTPNGYGTQASEGGVAIGESAHANGGNSVAVGRLSNAHGTQSVAIGYFSSAGNFKSIAIGNSAVSTGHSSISIGAASRAHYDRGIAVGQEAAVYEEGGISIGGFSGAGSGISIGLSSYTQSGIAVGSEAAAGGSASVAIGNNAYVAHASLGGIAIGRGAQAFTASNLAIGYQARAHSFATVLGSFATAGAMSVCSGYKASATNECSVVIGAGAVSSNQYALSAGYDSSANGEMSVAVGTHSIAAGYGCLALGAFSNSSTHGGVSIGYKSRSLGGIAIGYESSASDGMMSLTVYHSSGRRFNYSYGCDGYLYSMYSNSTSSGTYTRSWDNLLTPPNYNTAVSINTNTEYTADRPAYIVFNVYAGGASGYVVEFIKNGFAVFNVGVLYGLTTYNIIPVSKGDKYKLNIIDHGATNPAVYAYRIYPS